MASKDYQFTQTMVSRPLLNMPEPKIGVFNRVLLLKVKVLKTALRNFYSFLKITEFSDRTK